MAKYILNALSVQIGGKVFRKEDKTVFDTAKEFKPWTKEVEQAAAKGFLKKAPAQKAKKDVTTNKEADKAGTSDKAGAPDKAAKATDTASSEAD